MLKKIRRNLRRHILHPSFTNSPATERVFQSCFHLMHTVSEHHHAFLTEASTLASVAACLRSAFNNDELYPCAPALLINLFILFVVVACACVRHVCTLYFCILAIRNILSLVLKRETMRNDEGVLSFRWHNSIVTDKPVVLMMALTLKQRLWPPTYTKPQVMRKLSIWRYNRMYFSRNCRCKRSWPYYSFSCWLSTYKPEGLNPLWSHVTGFLFMTSTRSHECDVTRSGDRNTSFLFSQRTPSSSS